MNRMPVNPPFVSEARVTRREMAGGAALLAALLAGPVPLLAASKAAPTGRFGPPVPFSWDRLVAQAQGLARRDYSPRPLSHAAVPDFDSHVRLTYDAAESLPGHVRLFPTRIGIAPHAVAIHVVENGHARALVDSHGLFGGGAAADPAGFRVLWPDGHADWLAFLGASYFRAAGSHDQFGLSARAVAVDTDRPGHEEFPDFTAFWIEAPAEDRLVIHALLDGPSLTGAFAIDTRRAADPFEGMTQDIRAALFLRRDVARLGLAPMTSMFLYGEGNPRADWRPEVHDSDGLAIHTAQGERIWHPLVDPAQPRVNAFRADGLRGFGLLQRDQTFDHYGDDLLYYERRPSLWVEPQGDWGPGAVTLYSFPSISETVDNVAAYWVSDVPAKAGGRRDYAYRLTWSSREPDADRNARCIALYKGPGGVPGAEPIAGASRFVFDFAGAVLDGLAAGSIEAVTDLPPAALVLKVVAPIGGQKGLWRVTLDVRTAGLPSEFRLFLRRGGDTISETVVASIDPDSLRQPKA